MPRSGKKGSALYELPFSSGHKTLLFSLSLVPFDVRVTAGQFMASSLRGGFLSYIVHSNGYSPARKGPAVLDCAAQRPHPCSSRHFFFHRLRAVGERLAACTCVVVHKGHLKMSILAGGATMGSIPPPILCGAYRSVATATARGQAAIAIKMLTSRKFGMPPLSLSLSLSSSSINQPIVGRTTD